MMMNYLIWTDYFDCIEKNYLLLKINLFLLFTMQLTKTVIDSAIATVLAIQAEERVLATIFTIDFNPL